MFYPLPHQAKFAFGAFGANGPALWCQLPGGGGGRRKGPRPSDPPVLLPSRLQHQKLVFRTSGSPLHSVEIIEDTMVQEQPNMLNEPTYSNRCTQIFGTWLNRRFSFLPFSFLSATLGCSILSNTASIILSNFSSLSLSSSSSLLASLRLSYSSRSRSCSLLFSSPMS